MTGNGIERDTLSGVIAALERTAEKWHNADNQTGWADFRDAIFYLKEYRDLLAKMGKDEKCEQSKT